MSIYIVLLSVIHSSIFQSVRERFWHQCARKKQNHNFRQLFVLSGWILPAAIMAPRNSKKCSRPSPVRSSAPIARKESLSRYVNRNQMWIKLTGKPCTVPKETALTVGLWPSTQLHWFLAQIWARKVLLPSNIFSKSWDLAPWAGDFSTCAASFQSAWWTLKMAKLHCSTRLPLFSQILDLLWLIVWQSIDDLTFSYFSWMQPCVLFTLILMVLTESPLLESSNQLADGQCALWRQRLKAFQGHEVILRRPGDLWSSMVVKMQGNEWTASNCQEPKGYLFLEKMSVMLQGHREINTMYFNSSLR